MYLKEHWRAVIINSLINKKDNIWGKSYLKEHVFTLIYTSCMAVYYFHNLNHN